ncbi:Helix-turn-helix domain-containing protein [Paenibacillus sophorae]|uniref:AraC family transcriptional regulator n=1 Tax=Paenibacillus sophorae TaxID=1333845 RepID=A0A1H8KGM8_9BACL|nr:AraC family transcriptional regulator [Paenibacillus sophorae]QWU13738.1 AraC family transcriptional regulator [Paenibacillus sophorae]SEN92044.1 Helix-turn-helix domain-containing protein [Paenibacillus sophorae]
MPQVDRHKERTVNIEFVAVEDFSILPYPERFTLIFITSGSIKGILNQRPISISAPGVLCLAEDAHVQVVEKINVSAQSFSFHPEFLNTITLSETKDYFPTWPRIQTGLSLFQSNNLYTGVPRVTEKAYPLLFEWFFVLGTEVQAQSDALWVCRIKKYLIQILGLLEELNRNNEHSPVDVVLDYIHTNYSKKISLEDLTKCVHLNRVTLNKMFQERCGNTAIGYLLSHRLKVASDLLTHTDMSLNEIARATGFEYDTYFIKQFTARKEMSPTKYRTTSRKFATAQ